MGTNFVQISSHSFITIEIAIYGKLRLLWPARFTSAAFVSGLATFCFCCLQANHRTALVLADFSTYRAMKHCIMLSHTALFFAFQADRENCLSTTFLSLAHKDTTCYSWLLCTFTKI